MRIALSTLLISLLWISKKEFTVERLDLQYWDSDGVAIVWLERSDSIFKTVYFEIDSVISEHPKQGDTLLVGIWPFSKPIECEGKKGEWHPGTMFPRCWKNLEGLSICPYNDSTQLYFIPNRWYCN